VKRGQTDLSLVVAVNKPEGMTSHDVVNRCRTIFGEKRVGHTGTLDPLASGVLPICIGPATRLSTYLTANEKRYRVRVGFGFETDTDDREGAPTARGTVPSKLFEDDFARAYLAGLIGEHDQVPPAYSAIKVNGRKAYERVRRGEDVQLEPRRITIMAAELVRVGEDDMARAFWDVDFAVSKGTYIRAIARDMGRELGCPAHVEALERTRSGRIALDDCVSLESLASLKEQAAIDPVRILGCRFAFADDIEKRVANGAPVDAAALRLYKPLPMVGDERICACSTTLKPSDAAPSQGEVVALVAQNRLIALYAYDERDGLFRSKCGFAEGVYRG
jgi:tRNA pseudouridine55 synthase